MNMQIRASRSSRSSLWAALFGVGAVGALFYTIPPPVTGAFLLLVIPTFAATGVETHTRPRFAMPFASVGSVLAYVVAQPFPHFTPFEPAAAQFAGTATLSVALLVLAVLYFIKATVDDDERWYRGTTVALLESVINVLI